MSQFEELYAKRTRFSPSVYYHRIFEGLPSPDSGSSRGGGAAWRAAPLRRWLDQAAAATAGRHKKRELRPAAWVLGAETERGADKVAGSALLDVLQYHGAIMMPPACSNHDYAWFLVLGHF